MSNPLQLQPLDYHAPPGHAVPCPARPDPAPPGPAMPTSGDANITGKPALANGQPAVVSPWIALPRRAQPYRAPPGRATPRRADVWCLTTPGRVLEMNARPAVVSPWITPPSRATPSPAKPGRACVQSIRPLVPSAQSHRASSQTCAQTGPSSQPSGPRHPYAGRLVHSSASPSGCGAGWLRPCATPSE